MTVFARRDVLAFACWGISFSVQMNIVKSLKMWSHSRKGHTELLSQRVDKVSNSGILRIEM